MPLATILLVSLLAAAPGVGTTVGIAEEFPSGDWGSPVVPQVRVGFVRTASGWEVRDEAPTKGRETDHLRWTVCFDGRTLGHVETEPVRSELYSRRGTHAPMAKQRIPFPGERTKEFGGWMNEGVHRPLVVSSRDRCADPERWRREKAGPELLARLIDHAQTATTEVCEGETRRQWRPQRSDVNVVKVYAADTGGRIAVVRVRPPDNECEDDPHNDTGAPFLVRIDSSGTISALGSGVVVDAGDYDGDGKSEVIVKYGAYNEDGYTMFYDGFARQVSLRWSYH